LFESVEIPVRALSENRRPIKKPAGAPADAKKARRCGRDALARIRLCSRRSCEEMGVANGERQIKIAGRGADVIEEARAD
jgi:hypothetical protein